MIAFLHLPKDSKTTVITLSDVFRKDLARLLGGLFVMMTLLYAIGWLISVADTKAWPLSYYIWVFFSQSPLVLPILTAAAAVLMVGLAPSVRFWSSIAAALISVLFLPRPSLTWILEPNDFLTGLVTIVLAFTAWRLWDYYELRRVLAMNEPTLTVPALAAYIVLGAAAIIMLIPLSF